MPLGLVFWVVYLVALVLSLVQSWPFSLGSAGTILFFVLIGILGWAQFGAMVR